MDLQLEKLLAGRAIMQSRDKALDIYKSDQDIKKDIDKLVGKVHLRLQGTENQDNELSILVNLADISINNTLNSRSTK